MIKIDNVLSSHWNVVLQSTQIYWVSYFDKSYDQSIDPPQQSTY